MPRGKALKESTFHFPLIHRWILYAGFFFFACWLPLALFGSIEMSAIDEVTAVAREFTPILLFLSITFIVFGICYDFGSIRCARTPKN